MSDHLQSEHDRRSEVELGASPVPAASVVPDFVVSPVSDPVGQGAVRNDLLGVAYFLAKTLNGSHLLSLLITTSSPTHYQIP